MVAVLYILGVALSVNLRLPLMVGIIYPEPIRPYVLQALCGLSFVRKSKENQGAAVKAKSDKVN